MLGTEVFVRWFMYLGVSIITPTGIASLKLHMYGYTHTYTHKTNIYILYNFR